jgi:alpha-L-fucosidase
MRSIASMARSLQPGLIIVDRDVEGDFQDYRTPEHRIPDQPPGGVWEACLPMAASWSYVPDDIHKPSRELIRILVDIVAKGGNLLLNIGPSPEGELPAASLERLKDLGAWMKVNSVAIHGTRAVAPYRQGNFGFTRGRDGFINAVYLADEDEDLLPPKLRIFGLRPRRGSSVIMLGVKTPMDWTPRRDGFEILVPDRVRSRPPCDHAWVFRFRADVGMTSFPRNVEQSR